MLRYLSLLILFAPPAALGDPFEDEEEDFDWDEEEDESAPERLDEADTDDLGDELEEADETESSDPENEDDLLDGADLNAPQSGDSEKIFRQTIDELDGKSAEDVAAGWRAYMERYPNTPFRGRIEERIDAAMDEIYDVRIGGTGEVENNREKELAFSQSMILENINPRSRIQVGFEWGLPDYINLIADYEHQILRNFSVHGGVRNRYTGWSVESGVHWALIKSTRTHTLLTILGDVHFNLDPAFIGFRPQLALGKRFGEKLDLQIQGGVDVEARKFAAVRFIGGTSIVYRAAPTVGLFSEANFNTKGPFRFNVVSFGMKFFPGAKNRDQMEMNVGAQVPYATNYLQYHFGSVTGQFNYYLD